MKHNSILNLLRKVHEDENGTISLETVLIMGAIALPVLIFLLYVGWPWIKGLFTQAQTDINNGVNTAPQSGQ